MVEDHFWKNAFLTPQPLGLGMGVQGPSRAILTGGNHQKRPIAGGLGVLEIAF